MPPTRPAQSIRRTFSLGRHAEAESLLLDAAEQCDRSEAKRGMHWRSVLKTLPNLYDAWHAAEPGKGYDAKAAEWRAKLSSEQPTPAEKKEAGPDSGRH